MKKKFIAKLLALSLVLTMVPATAFATGGDNNNYNYYYYFSTPDTNVIGVIDVADVTVEGGTATIKATVVGDTASVSLTDAVLESLAEKITDKELVLKIEAEGASKVDLSVSAKALTDFAKKTGAALTIELGDVATISIPNEALSTVFGETGTVKVSAQSGGDSVGFSIKLNGKSLTNIKGLEVTF